MNTMVLLIEKVLTNILYSVHNIKVIISIHNSMMGCMVQVENESVVTHLSELHDKKVNAKVQGKLSVEVETT